MVADSQNLIPNEGNLSRKDLEEILDSGRELQAEVDEREQADKKAEKKRLDDRVRKITESGNVQETVRDMLMGEVQPLMDQAAAAKPDSVQKGGDLVKKRRKELRTLLENLSDEIEGKSAEEVAAVMSSFLNITSQLSLQKTDGVISVRCRLASLFYGANHTGPVPAEMRQEINLIFSPEEVEAIRIRLEVTPDDDPMKPFFNTVLDQAFDVIQYNEMTGMILVEMTRYFLDRLEEHGLDMHPKYVEYKERHDRSMASLAKAIQELRDVQMVINNHMKDHPVLEEFPKALRLLIQVRLGMLPQKMVPELIEIVRNKQGAYARARSVVAFDFNRLPSFQHGVRLRQSAILNLHKDVLKFTGDQLESEFSKVSSEFETLMADIEAASVTLDPNSPEYEEMMRRKELMQKKISEHRRKLDVLKSQERLVDVQHAQVRSAIERYKEQDAIAQKASELQDQAKIDPSKIREKQSADAGRRKPATRMVTASFRGNR